jgi:hypothetical protein
MSNGFIGVMVLMAAVATKVKGQARVGFHEITNKPVTLHRGCVMEKYRGFRTSAGH